MKSILFLGAGASKFVSHPTTKDLLEQVEKQIETEIPDESKLFIKNLLSERSLDDVEKLYDVIDYITNLEKHPNGNIANNMYYKISNDFISYEQMVVGLEKLKSIIREILLNAFTIDNESLDTIKIMYDKVWHVMQNNGSDKFQVVTTNYDKVIERYCEKSNFEIIDGFSPTLNGDSRIWSDKWEPKTDKPTLYLSKLHGSITWQNENDSIIDMKIPGRRDEKDDFMILPTLGPKDYSRSPFYQIMNRFKEILSSTDMLIVIGFSYRDPQISEIIKQRLSEGMTLISISPTPSEMNNISERNDTPIDMSINNHFHFYHFPRLGILHLPITQSLL